MFVYCIYRLHLYYNIDRDQDGFVSYNDLHSFCKEHFDIEKRIRHRNANVNRSNSVRKSSFRVQDSMVTRSAAEMAHGAYINPADYMDPSKPTGPKAAGKELDVDQKHLWKLLKGIIFILDDSRRNSLTFDDVSKYYLNYCKEKKEAEAMVLKNSIPPNGVPKNAFNKRKLRQSWDAERGTDANDWISSGDPVIDSDVVHRKLLYSSGGYGIKRGKCKQDMDKRIDSKLEEAYRNEHKKQPNLLFYLIFYAYLENDNISSFANKNEIGNGIVVDDEGEDAILDTVDCTIHSAELLLLPALYVSDALFIRHDYVF